MEQTQEIKIGDKVRIWSFTLLRDAVVIKVSPKKVRVEFKNTRGYLRYAWRYKKDVKQLNSDASPPKTEVMGIRSEEFI